MTFAPVLISLTVLCTVLPACAKPIDCNDPAVQAQVMQRIDRNFSETAWYPKVKEFITTPQLINMQTVVKNEEINQITCRAAYAFDYNNKSQKVRIEFSLSYLEESNRFLMRFDPSYLSRVLQGVLLHATEVKRRQSQAVSPTWN